MRIFKAYDIRGTYPSQINEEMMEKIGRAFADFIEGEKIAVGRDMRVSSPQLFDAFVKGILTQGKDVIDFGLTSTPMTYFACNHLKADASAMITASHNPKEDNGVKFTRSGAIPISGDTGIKEIEAKVLANDFKEVPEPGKVIKEDVKDAFREFLLGFAKEISGLKIVVDGSNGMGAQDFSIIQKDLPIDITTLCFDLDGTFPHHDANPMKEGAVSMLADAVKEKNADLGIIFDGDADRVFFVDDTGELVPSDYITALIAEEILAYHPSSIILYDLRSSWIVPEKIAEFGGKSRMCRVGHSFIKQSMREEDSIFAGELSGHFYFRDAFYTDSGILTAIWVLNLLSKKKEKLSSLIAPLKKYFATGEINSEVSDKDAKMRELAEIYKEGSISWLDGVRIDFEDWWFNVRPSNTEPLLRLNLEAKTEQLMTQKRDEVLSIIRATE